MNIKYQNTTVNYNFYFFNKKNSSDLIVYCNFFNIKTCFCF